MKRDRHVVFVMFDEVAILDVTGPMTAFWSASRLVPRGGYRVELASAGGRPVTTIEGMRVAPDVALADVDAAIDTLVVPGRGGTPPLSDCGSAITSAARACRARRLRSAHSCGRC